MALMLGTRRTLTSFVGFYGNSRFHGIHQFSQASQLTRPCQQQSHYAKYSIMVRRPLVHPLVDNTNMIPFFFGVHVQTHTFFSPWLMKTEEKGCYCETKICSF